MGRESPEKPSTPGWYPDPWSADGRGERYWDGRRWRGSDRADHPEVVTRESRRQTKKAERSAAPGRDHRRTVVGIIVLVAIAFGIVYLQRRGDDSGGSGGADTESAVARVGAPPAGAGAASAPLGRPAPVPAGTGSYELLATQPDDGDAPVAWDPCRAVHYGVDPGGAPEDGDALVAEAITTLSRATGLRFVADGATDERPAKDRAAYLPGRYGADRWAPVLIAWASQDEFPALSGYIAGVAGPSSVQVGDSPAVYVSGQVVLDREQLSTTTTPDRTDARAVVLHELGHLAGLDHTADAGQLMYSEATRNVRDYQVGDLTGLAELGTQACVPEV